MKFDWRFVYPEDILLLYDELNIISCIFWEEKGEYFITIYEAIKLVELLNGVPRKKKKNEMERNEQKREQERIRKLIHEHCPSSHEISWKKHESMFQTVYRFPRPKPFVGRRNKTKLICWAELSSALETIYSAVSFLLNAEYLVHTVYLFW